MIGISSFFVLALAMVLCYRFWQSYKQSKQFTLLPRTPSVTQITVLLGILSYAITVQFTGHGIESWFDVRAEQISDSHNKPDRGTSLKEFGSSQTVLNRQTAQQQNPSTAKEDSGEIPLPDNASQVNKQATDNQTAQPSASALKPPLIEDSVRSEPLEPQLPSTNSMQTVHHPVAGPTTTKEDLGTFSSSAVPALATVLVLGLAMVFGYRLWRSRNPLRNKLFAAQPVRRRTPTVTQLAILLVVLGYAVAAQFPGNGIGSWFDARVEKPLGNHTGTGESSNVKELAASSSTLDEKIVLQAESAATKEDSGAFSLPSGTNQPDKATVDKQPEQLAVPSTPKNDSGVFHSFKMQLLAGLFVLGLAGALGYRFWRLRNNIANNLSVSKRPPRWASFAMIAASLCILIYVVMMQFLGKSIEEKPVDSNLKELLATTPKVPEPAAPQETAPLTDKDETATPPPDDNVRFPEKPAGNQKVARDVTPLAAKKNVMAFSPSESVHIPGKPVTGEKAVQSTAPLMAKENALSPADNARLPDRLVAGRPVTQEAAPPTIKEESAPISFAKSPDLPDVIDDTIPQQTVYKAQPAYPPRQLRRPTGRYAFNGSMGVQSENSEFSNDVGKQKRQDLRTNINLNNRGFAYHPNLVTYDASIALEKSTMNTTDSTSSVKTNSDFSMLNYRVNTNWFAKKPYATNLYGSRTQSTISAYQMPSYDMTNTNMGARWNWDNRWAGRMRFYLDKMQADSDSTSSPRSDQNHSFGVDSTLKLRPKQWGESDISYGFKHSAMSEQISGSSQTQNYMHISDGSTLGDKMKLRANFTYSNQRYQDGYSGLGATTNNFLNFNSGLSVQHSEKLYNSYLVSLNTYDSQTSKTSNQLFSGSSNYKLSPQWHTNGSLALNLTKTESLGSTSQTSSSTFGNGGVNYSNKFGVYLVNGGYNLALSRTDSSQADTPTRQSAMQSVNIGYSRTGSPRYADSLQLRMSQATGSDNKSNEFNTHYGVNSLWSQNDMLQGSIDYRHFVQSYTDLTGISGGYSTNSTNINTNGGWQHRFSDRANMNLSLSANQTTNNGTKSSSNSAQVSAAILLQSNMQLNALARMETYKGTETYSGNKLTVESNLNYRIGKWYAGARYRYSDARLKENPFKEQSIFLTVTRTYGFSF